MAEVGRVRSRLELEISGFQRSITRIQRSLDRTQAELRRTGSEGTRAFTRMERSSNSLARSFLRLRTAVVGYLSVQSARSIFQQAIAFENLDIQLQNVFGSQEQANQALARVQSVAQSTGSRMRDLTQAYVGLTAASEGSGLAQGEIDRIFRAVIISGRGLGRTNFEINAGLRQIQQSLAQNRVQWDELKILFENLPGIQRAFNRNLDGTTRNLREMTNAGADARAVFIPFADAAERIFGPAMARARESTQAAVNAILNAWDRLVKELVDSGALKAVADGILSIASAWETVSRILGTGTRGRLQAAHDQLKFLGDELNALEAIGRPEATKFDTLMQLLPERLRPQTSAQAFDAQNKRLRDAIKEQIRLIKELDEQLRGTRGPTGAGLPPLRTGAPAAPSTMPGLPIVAGMGQAADAHTQAFESIQQEQFQLQLIFDRSRVDMARNAAATRQAFQRMQSIITTVTQTIGAAFAQMTIGILRGTQTMQEALGNLSDALAAAAINFAIQTGLSAAGSALLAGLAPGPARAPGSAGGPSSGSGAIFGGPGGALGVGNRSFSIINVASPSAAAGISAQESAQGRQVIVNTLTEEFARGNSSAVVRMARRTLGR